MQGHLTSRGIRIQQHRIRVTTCGYKNALTCCCMVINRYPSLLRMGSCRFSPSQTATAWARLITCCRSHNYANRIYPDPLRAHTLARVRVTRFVVYSRVSHFYKLTRARSSELLSSDNPFKSATSIQGYRRRYIGLQL